MPRQILKATYTQYQYFKIPKGIDLEDETIVKEWWVKYGELHIQYVDETKEIERIDGITNEIDYKYPDDDPQVIDANDGYEFLFDDSELESDDEEFEIEIPVKKK